MRIVIPTYRRPRVQRTLETFSWLRPQVTLVVRPEEEKEHRDLHPDVDVLALPPRVQSLPATRQWVLERFGHERFVMADDDVSEIRRRRWEGDRIVSEPVSSSADLSLLLDAMERELEAGASLGRTGLCSPSPNWLPPDTHYTDREGRPGKKSAGQCLQLVAVDGPKLTAAGVRYDRVDMAEDVDVLLQVLAASLDAVQLMGWAFVVPPMGSQSGGIGLEKKERAVKEERAMAKLSLLWPGYVQVGKRSGEKWSVYRSRLLKDARRGSVKSRSLEEVALLELPPVPTKAPAVFLPPSAMSLKGTQVEGIRFSEVDKATGWPFGPPAGPGWVEKVSDGWEYVASPEGLSRSLAVAWMNERGREGWRLVPGGFAGRPADPGDDACLMERRRVS